MFQGDCGNLLSHKQKLDENGLTNLDEMFQTSKEIKLLRQDQRSLKWKVDCGLRSVPAQIINFLYIFLFSNILNLESCGNSQGNRDKKTILQDVKLKPAPRAYSKILLHDLKVKSWKCFSIFQKILCKFDRGLLQTY